MTIEDFLRLLLRNLLLLVIVTVLGAAAGYGFSYTKTPQYAASALGYVSVGSSSETAQAGATMQAQYQRAQTYLPLFSTRVVGERIVETTGVGMSPNQVAGSLSATIDPNAPIITVTAVASDAETAGKIADAAVEAVAVEARTIETGGNENASAAYQLVVYQTATPPGAPISPDRNRFAAAGAAAGLLIALALAWLRDRNDSRIRTADDVVEGLGVPLLGTLPDSREMNRGKDGVLPELTAFETREAVRKLRTNLRYIDVDAPPRSIVVTSSAPGEGKSTVSANLARVMARAGQPTLLIDADLRRPKVAEEFGVDGSVGLSQLLAGAVMLDAAVQPTSTPMLSLLPAGQVPPNPSELLGSRRMKELIEELSGQFFIIVDAPPVLAVTDAQLLSRHTDGAILVAVPGRSRSIAVSRAIESLRSIGGKVYGIVLNRASQSRFTRLAYGDAEYGYGAYGRYAYGGKNGYAQAEAQIADIEIADAGGPAEPLTESAVPAPPVEENTGPRRRRAAAPAAAPSAPAAAPAPAPSAAPSAAPSDEGSARGPVSTTAAAAAAYSSLSTRSATPAPARSASPAPAHSAAPAPSPAPAPRRAAEDTGEDPR